MALRSSLVVRTIVAVSVAVGMVHTIPGCASSTERAASEARSSVSKFRENLEAMPNNIDRTIAALDEMRSTQNTNRAKTYRDLSTQFAWMQNRAKDLGEQADKATSDSDAYFRAWVGEAMKNSSSEERREAQDAISARRDLRDQAVRYLSEGRQQYTELANSIRDLQTSLRGNLTQANVSALTPQIERTVLKATDVKEYIARLDEQIDAILNVR